jgi:hypothetical protein
MLCADIITQVPVFTISIKLKLFIQLSLLDVSAVNYRPSSGNSYIRSAYTAILLFPLANIYIWVKVVSLYTLQNGGFSDLECIYLNM